MRYESANPETIEYAKVYSEMKRISQVKGVIPSCLFSFHSHYRQSIIKYSLRQRQNIKCAKLILSADLNG